MMHEFWNAQWRWPRNPQGRIFLARAVCQVGTALFGEDWEDSDPGAQIILPLPPFSSGMKRGHFPKPNDAHLEMRTANSGWANTRVLALLQKVHPGYELRMGPSPIPPSLMNLTSNPPAPYFTKEEWELADAENNKEIKEDPARRSLKRAWAAINKITDWATEGDLQTFVRPPDELDLFPLRPDWWSAVNLNNVFTTCQMDPTKPLSIYCAGDKFGWIFVDRVGFLACLQALSGAGPGSIEEAEARPTDRNPYLSAFEAGMERGMGSAREQLANRPAHEAPSSPTEPKDCISWLATVMAASPLSRTRTKSDLFAEGQARFPDLSKRAFDRTYADAAEAADAKAWLKGGRPEKKS